MFTPLTQSLGQYMDLHVSLDREARMLAENALRFNVASNLMRGEIRTIRKAVEEGRGA